MFRSLIALWAMAMPSVAGAHALFPAAQTVQTVSERGFARFEAANGRTDASDFVVEIFDMDWQPSRLAVASPAHLLVPARARDENEAATRPFSVLIDLDGEPSRQLRVCTKTVFRANPLRPRLARVTSRVCVTAIVKRFQP